MWLLVLLLEMCSFIFVIHIMVPITSKKKMVRQELSKFLLNGFADFTELESVVIAANPSMTDFELRMVEESLGRVRFFLNST